MLSVGFRENCRKEGSNLVPQELTSNRVISESCRRSVGSRNILKLNTSALVTKF